MTPLPSTPTPEPSPVEVEYARGGGTAQRLDVHAQPPGVDTPTVLYIHGGGWCAGDKRDDQPLFDAFRRAGLVCVSANYRLAPRHPWPACFEDVNAALDWTVAHAAEHGGDPARLIVAGYSAGGHLALHLAVTRRDTPIRGMIGLAAPTDWVLDNFRRMSLSPSMRQLFGQEQVDHAVLDRLWNASPINHLTHRVPPCLQIHGTGDKSVPISQGRHFHARLEQLGVDSTLMEISDATHRFHEWPNQLPGVFGALTDWIGHVTTAPRTKRSDPSPTTTSE